MSTRVVVNIAALRPAARRLHELSNEVEQESRRLRTVRFDGVTAAEARPLDREADEIAADLRRVSNELQEQSRILRRRIAAVEEVSGYRAPAGLRQLPLSRLRWNPTNWAKRKALAAARRLIRSRFPWLHNALKAVWRASEAYRRIASKASGGVFWGHYCGKENESGPHGYFGSSRWDNPYMAGTSVVMGYEREPRDTLDSCCARHDAAYRALRLGAQSQFSPRGLAASATVNIQMMNCARRQPHRSGLDSWAKVPYFQNFRVDNGVVGGDARRGVMALFGTLGAVGHGIRAAIDRVNRVPGVPTGVAEWAVYKVLNSAWSASSWVVGKLEGIT